MEYMKLIIWKIKKLRNLADQPDSQTLSFLKLSIIEPASFSTECWEFRYTLLWKFNTWKERTLGYIRFTDSKGVQGCPQKQSKFEVNLQ